MKAYGGVDVFLTSALVTRGESSDSRPGRFAVGERALGTHRRGGWVGPRAGLDNVERRKSCLYQDSTSVQPIAVAISKTVSDFEECRKIQQYESPFNHCPCALHRQRRFQEVENFITEVVYRLSPRAVGGRPTEVQHLQFYKSGFETLPCANRSPLGDLKAIHYSLN
jgi:hypothetical protein